MPDSRSARQASIVHLLQTRGWMSSVSLAARFGVSPRTVYRDVEQLIASGIPIEASAGRNGGFRLARENPAQTMVDSDDALLFYVLSDMASGTDQPEVLPSSVSAQARRAVQTLSRRIHFDTTDWYWRDDGSGHLPVLRNAVLKNTAVQLLIRRKGEATPASVVVKPYGLVWKAGDWWLVGAHLDGEIARFKLTNLERVTTTDLQFQLPDSFALADWWRTALEDYGRGPVKVVLLVQPDSREEMLRLNLKPDSEVRDGADGTVYITLYVDRWRWLIPLLSAFGGQVRVLEPGALVQAMKEHHAAAVETYTQTAEPAPNHATPYRHDDSRLRATRGRSPGADTFG